MGVYAQIEGCDGQCPVKVEGLSDHIELLSFDFSISKPNTAGGTGRAGGGGAAVPSDIGMNIDYEKSMPAIQTKMFKGEPIPKVVIKFTATIDNKPNAVYLTYEFENCHFTGYSLSGQGGEGAGHPDVNVQMSFETIKSEYKHFDAEGNSENVPAAAFNVRSRENA
jgi:type VI protein secretion system component Hcp